MRRPIEHRRWHAKSNALRLISSARWIVVFCGASILTGRPKAVFNAPFFFSLVAPLAVALRAFLRMGCSPAFNILEVMYTFN